MKKLNPAILEIALIALLLYNLMPNTSFAQPIIKVWGHQDPQAIKHQIGKYLDHLEVHENIYLIVSYSENMTKKLPGVTTCQKTSDKSIDCVIRVWIRANMNQQRQGMVLAHEMIHVKQFAKQELVVLNEKQALWKGQKVYYTSDGIYDYQQTPWEAEAHRTDGLLVKLGNKQHSVPLTASKNHP